MKIMLLKDVYKLGRAGEIKKVAAGFGRNYLLPQGLAVLATPGAISSADRIRDEADKNREVLNHELGGLALQLQNQTVTFPVRASETGKLYGSVTTRMIISAVNEALDVELSHRQVDGQPIRFLGEYNFPIRLTIDLAPEIKVIIYREGEGIESAYENDDDEEDEAGEVEAVEDAAPEAEVEAVEEAAPEADVEAVEEAAPEAEVEAVEDAAPEAEVETETKEEAAE